MFQLGAREVSLIAVTEMREVARMGKRDKELNREVGGRVKDLRERNGLTQSELAKFIGLADGGTLSKYENGSRGFGFGHLEKICEKFGVSLDQLVFGRDYPPVMNAEEKRVLLTALGHGDPILPDAVLEFINANWVRPMTQQDVIGLCRHLTEGGSPSPFDLLVRLWSNRLQSDGSEETMRALNEANRRRAEAMGGKRLVEHEKPPRTVSAKAVNDERPKHLRLRRRKKSPSRAD